MTAAALRTLSSMPVLTFAGSAVHASIQPSRRRASLRVVAGAVSAAPAPPMYLHLGTVPIEAPPAGGVAAVVVPPADGFADPPGLLVRDDVLAAVGGPEPVRAGALADLVARIESAGHAVERRALPVAPRRPAPAALHREGSARFWLFRRHPARFPLPGPRDAGWRLPFLALGALHANGAPTKPDR
jgi:hypothetical protein